LQLESFRFWFKLSEMSAASVANLAKVLWSDMSYSRVLLGSVISRLE
jgi:hypothetical protein